MTQNTVAPQSAMQPHMPMQTDSKILVTSLPIPEIQVTPEMAKATSQLIRGMRIDFGQAMPEPGVFDRLVQRWATRLTRYQVPAVEVNELYILTCERRRKEGKWLSSFPPTIDNIIEEFEYWCRITGHETRLDQTARELQARRENAPQPGGEMPERFKEVLEKTRARSGKL